MSIHVEQDGECAVCIQQVTPGLRFARVSWPCDAADAIARADKAEAALAALGPWLAFWRNEEPCPACGHDEGEHVAYCAADGVDNCACLIDLAAAHKEATK